VPLEKTAADELCVIPWQRSLARPFPHYASLNAGYWPAQTSV
jgi:hypothetical protein